MRTRVFVSHSAKSDADKAVLDQLVSDLKAADLDVWVDYERLGAGADWNKDITTELQNCHAAIVLFSEQALQSEFVKYEVSALVHRKRVQSAFPLFTLMLEDTSVAAIKTAFYAAIEIAQFQLKPLAAAKQDVIQKLCAIAPDALTAVSDVEGQLMQQFRAINPSNLIRAARELQFLMPDLQGWEMTPAEFSDAAALAFVRAMLAQSIDGQLKALLKVENFLEATKKGSFIEVFDLIAPCWVNDQAAQRLFGARRAEPGKRAAIVNATQGDWTCRMFMLRAAPGQDALLLNDGGPASGGGAVHMGTVVPVGRDVAGDLESQILRALCLRHCVAEGPDTDVALDQAMADEEDLFDVYPIQVVDLQGVDVSVIKPLLTRFKRLTLIVTSGPALPQNLPPDLAAIVITIEPPLQHTGDRTSHDEVHAHKIYNSAPMRERRLRQTGSN